MHGALLVPHENVLESFGGEQRIVDRKYGTAGVTEDVLHALVLEGADHHLGTAQFDRTGLASGDPAQCLLVLVHHGHSFFTETVPARNAKGALPPLGYKPPLGNEVILVR